MAHSVIKHKHLLFYTTLPLCAESVGLQESEELAAGWNRTQLVLEQTWQLPQKEYKMWKTSRKPRIILGTNWGNFRMISFQNKTLRGWWCTGTGYTLNVLSKAQNLSLLFSPALNAAGHNAESVAQHTRKRVLEKLLQVMTTILQSQSLHLPPLARVGGPVMRSKPEISCDKSHILLQVQR